MSRFLQSFALPRTSREQHVADSSNHSLSLIKLFVFSSPEGNKLLDSSIRLSPLSQGITNDLNVSIATSLHQRLPFSNLVHHLFKSSLKPLSRSRNIYIDKDIDIDFRIYIDFRKNQKSVYTYIIMNRHGHNNIRNGIVCSQPGHSTCTCTATLCCVCD